MKLDIRPCTRTRTVRVVVQYILRVYILAYTRAVTLSPPPVHTNLASRMAIQRDVRYNQISLNACVLLVYDL
jgi:hypothetical protein